MQRTRYDQRIYAEFLSTTFDFYEVTIFFSSILCLIFEFVFCVYALIQCLDGLDLQQFHDLVGIFTRMLVLSARNETKLGFGCVAKCAMVVLTAGGEFKRTVDYSWRA